MLGLLSRVSQQTPATAVLAPSHDLFSDTFLEQEECGDHNKYRQNCGDHAGLGCGGVLHCFCLKDKIEAWFAEGHEKDQLIVTTAIMQGLGDSLADQQKTEGSDQHATKNHHHGIIGPKGNFEGNKRAGPEHCREQQGKSREAAIPDAGQTNHREKKSKGMLWPHQLKDQLLKADN